MLAVAMALTTELEPASSIQVVVLGGGNPSTLERVLQMLPATCGFATIVVCRGAARLADRLRGKLAVPVVAVRDSVAVEQDHVYVLPDAIEATFHRGELRVHGGAESAAPLGQLLRSLADELGSSVAAVILGGAGNDGALGLKRVKEIGGLTIAQTPEPGVGSAGDAEMPRAAIGTGAVDLVLAVDEI